ncbi:uroporphyrinogen decarboxylase family protein [Acidobacteriota bacterium]
MQTSREIVQRCLRFETPERIPRDLWLLPWAEKRYPETIKYILAQYPSDFTAPDFLYSPSPRIKGDPYSIGLYTDEWGCTFENIQEGVIGEVKDPQISDLRGWKSIRPPYEQLPANEGRALDLINRFCADSDLFVIANICPRPWERYQFLRGTENALTDLLMAGEEVLGILQTIHDFYLKELEFWVRSDVDAIMFMDDWGGQDQLLIHPEIWREIFKPMYSDYSDLAHSRSKFAFMHSDGYILPIFPDLIKAGVDAINSQLFCMDITEIARTAKGRITFWGEIDRQQVLPSPDPDVGREAVRYVSKHLYDPKGGLIAQFEFTPGSNPDTARVLFDEWMRVEQRYKTHPVV